MTHLVSVLSKSESTPTDLDFEERRIRRTPVWSIAPD